MEDRTCVLVPDLDQREAERVQSDGGQGLGPAPSGDGLQSVFCSYFVPAMEGVTSEMCKDLPLEDSRIENKASVLSTL